MSISSKSHTLTMLAQEAGIEFCEITEDSASTQRPNRFYVISRHGYDVMSCIPSDCPPDGGLWRSSHTPGGVSYVANGRSRATARRWFRRMAAEAKAYNF